ncbi:MAG: excinuclease ABC subunit UvrA [Opitutales bacterium]|nr:excinuclease ABC subunit UvrA [Opitutales bacterium]
MSPKPHESFIHVSGARVHNLKNINVDIPREKIVVFTGVSGSGKSSLAFDTIYAEGYRKYMDSLSTHARQLMEQMDRPDVDYIHGLSPVIAIEQRTGASANPRSTVASATEVADYASLIWALCGQAHCPDDGAPIVQRNLDDCIARLYEEPEGSRLMLLAPVLSEKPSVLRDEIPRLRQKGYQRIRIYGEIRDLQETDLIRSGKEKVDVDVVIDRIVLQADQKSRIADSLELAFEEGNNRAIALLQIERDAPWQEIVLSQHLSCSQCGKVYPPITTKFFSSSHPDGACPTCGGLGHTLQFSPDLVVPDTSLSTKNGAIKPWRLGSKAMIIKRNAILKQLAEQVPFDPQCPWDQLPSEVRLLILSGTRERMFAFKLKAGNSKPVEQYFSGVLADLEETRRETSSDGLKAKLMAYQIKGECPECHGKRLRRESLSVYLNDLDYASFMQLPIQDALVFVERLEDAVPQVKHIMDAWTGLRQRLQFLCRVGLGYLQLNRRYATLSGGEAQRVRLATQLGMELVGVTYVLDEPTVGLHPHDTRKLLQTLKELRDHGNSVLVVEHDDETISCADELIELGPGAGERGGQLIYQGTPEMAKIDIASITGPFLSGKDRIRKEAATLTPGKVWLEVKGAAEHNLKQVDVSFPVGLLTVVTGVSGSGKSSLVRDVLSNAAAFKLNRAKTIPGKHEGIYGLQFFKSVVRVDQSPIGQSPRSNPATYTKLFDHLRQLYALCPLSRIRGYSASRFSFNVSGGRCERCKGDGQIKLDMQFLSDVYTECPSCHGQRYNRETLEVRFKGFNIAEALDLTVDEACQVFANQPKLISRLETLQAVGLGYIRLGQAANTLSGGEAQRIKLSLELSRQNQGDTLYILDEPTTGLHWLDVQHLVDLLYRLRDRGNTIVVVEHNKDMIRTADWVIDMGPGAGEEGGTVVYEGTLSGLMQCPQSLTAQCL